jgi:hypothetical protein
MTVAQWVSAINAVETAAEAAQDAEAALDGARGNRDLAAKNLLTKARQILTMAKVKFRDQSNKLNLFREIKLNSPSPNRVIAGAMEVESAWEQADPGWEPLGQPVNEFKAERVEATNLLEAQQDKESAWKDKEELLNNLCRDLNVKNVGWYAIATALFAEGTQYGDLIRSQIPTTYTPPPPEPAKAVITSGAPSGADGIQLSYASERATGFNIYFRPEAGPEVFTKIADNIPDATFLHDGLAAGTYEYQVAGVNSDGEGEKSEIATVTVAG